MSSPEDFAAQGESAACAALAAPDLSVIIPTFNRADTLERVLAALGNQASSSSFEIVAVDDGSSDGTPEVLAAFAARARCAFRFACLRANRGPAAARNRALRLSRGRVLLITGDDIVPAPDLIERHGQWHRSHPSACEALLGRVTWPPAPPPTPFMRWMETGGRAFFFNYADLAPGRPAGGSFFYTANVSLKRELLFRTELFDESFPFASHEDLELGRRLEALGMQLYFEPSVLGYHWHPLTLASVARRVYLMGYSARLYWGKVRDDSPALRKALRAVLARVCALPVFPLVWKAALGCRAREDQEHPLLWKTILVLSYWIGLADAASGRPVRPLPPARRG